MQNATIFEIREFCLHDGDGIRTTVFFKGCPLRCTWCHNPEGLCPKPELLLKPGKCLHCGGCERVCPHASSPRSANGIPIDCAACGKCARVCPSSCRQLCGRLWTVDELVKELRKNEDVFKSFNGGITFSGGEPLMQGDFVAAVSQKLHPINLAIETSGFAPHELYKKVISKMDSVFQDLKHPDPTEHKRWTGTDPSIIHHNLAWLKKTRKPFVARIPLIPGVNDSREAKEGFARLLEGDSGLLRVELLPYHLTAGAKYPFTGKEYMPQFNETSPLDTDTTVFAEHGIKAVIM